jgi:predicted RNA-binding Zn ribbon-like protein
MQTVAHAFRQQDLVAGNVALDFANTVTARDTRPVDWIDGYPRIVEWARLAGLVDDEVARRLLAEAARAPREASAALGRARRLREALHDVCVALIGGDTAPAAGAAELESAWKRAASRARLRARKGQLTLAPAAADRGLDLPLDIVAFQAMALLSDFDVERTRVCRGHDCGWLFLDTSKGGRRVWCDMATCGNAAKSERFLRASRRRARRFPA